MSTISPPHSSFLQVQTNDDRGRHSVLTRPCVPGQVLLSAPTFAKTVLSDLRGVVCDFCFSRSRTNTMFMRCSRCKSAFYCSVHCQRLHYEVHKLECKTSALQRLLARTSDPLALLTLRVVLRRELPPFGLTNEGTFEEVLNLSSADVLGGISSTRLDSLCSYIGQALPEAYSSSKIKKILKRIACNAFTITDEELKPLGVGLYPPASYVNHSCDPNSCFLFKGTQITLISLKELNPGDEITVNYVELAEPLSRRRETIMKQYSFICRCQRCTSADISGHDLLVATNSWTPQKYEYNWPGIDGILQQVRCLNCNELGIYSKSGFYCVCDAPEFSQNYEVFTKLASKANSLISQMRWQDSFNLLEEAFSIGQNIFGPHHFELRMALIDFADCCVYLGLWEKALEVFEKLITTSKIIFPRNFPLIGVQEFARAKLMSVVKSDKEVVNAFRKAFSHLSVSHKACAPQMVADCLKTLNEVSVNVKDTGSRSGSI
ncbi:hypothetical protein RCL1_004319 [Eukaryota sp. TZLM3-RCL]